MDDALRAYAEWVLHPPLPEDPPLCRSSYFVCGAPRCGSWLLCGLLAGTGIAGRPHEWFWRDTEEANRRAWGASDFSEYVARAREAGTSPNGIFGAKLMWQQVGDLVRRLRTRGGASSQKAVIAEHFPSPTFIWIEREDVAAQAVSWAKAIQTGRWHHWDPTFARAAPTYDREQIAALAAEVASNNAAWRAWFAANELDPLAVRFEDVVADPAGVTGTVLNFLGIAAEGVPISALTVRASEGLNEKWLARYRSESQPDGPGGASET
jgi:LPS sulfotransferase NodH